MAKTLYWHDYETFGADPRRDRPSQFAGIRTDEDLNIIDEPLTIFCKPATDFLPQPMACLITGITPQSAMDKGVSEAEFISRIHEQLARPGTCGVGYNSIRFDDEVTRHTLYRNFFDAYAREWQNGNSRWDIIDMVRVCYALRPEGIEWPQYEDGRPCFKLEELTRANGISHEAAHDAMSDVHATIDMARLVKTKQPRLYEYIYTHRDKRSISDLLALGSWEPVLHGSSMYSSEHGSLAMVVPVAQDPVNKNAIIVYDLRFDPEIFDGLDIEQMRERLFTRSDDMPEGMQRLPLKQLHINKCPVVVPLNTLNDEAAERLQINREEHLEHLRKLRNMPELIGKLRDVYADKSYAKDSDPDLMLYSGGFFGDDDRSRMNRVRQMSAEELATASFSFKDKRLPEMLFRYRARNYPGSLSADEVSRWSAYCRERLTVTGTGASIVYNEYMAEIAGIMDSDTVTERDRTILLELIDYAENLLNRV